VLPKFVEYEQRFGSVVVGAIRNKAKNNGHAPIFQTLKSGMGTWIRTLADQVALIRGRVGSPAGAEEGWQLHLDLRLPRRTGEAASACENFPLN
jgi:hypothetical protein